MDIDLSITDDIALITMDDGTVVWDGDLVFAAATGTAGAVDQEPLLARIGHAAAVCLSRAIARAVYEARPAEGDILPCWSELNG